MKEIWLFFGGGFFQKATSPWKKSSKSVIGVIK